jgi:hypothetical protein
MHIPRVLLGERALRVLVIALSGRPRRDDDSNMRQTESRNERTRIEKVFGTRRNKCLQGPKIFPHPLSGDRGPIIL